MYAVETPTNQQQNLDKQLEHPEQRQEQPVTPTDAGTEDQEQQQRNTATGGTHLLPTPPPAGRAASESPQILPACQA